MVSDLNPDTPATTPADPAVNNTRGPERGLSSPQQSPKEIGHSSSPAGRDFEACCGLESPRSAPLRFGRQKGFVIALAAMASLGLFLCTVFWRDGYLGDEGFYGVTALNMLRSPAYILRPS